MSHVISLFNGYERTFGGEEVDSNLYLKVYFDFIDKYLRDLSGSAIKVFFVIARHARAETGRAFPSIETIGEKTGLSKNTVVAAINELCDYADSNGDVFLMGLKKRYSAGSTGEDGEARGGEFASTEYIVLPTRREREELSHLDRRAGKKRSDIEKGVPQIYEPVKKLPAKKATASQEEESSKEPQTVYQKTVYQKLGTNYIHDSKQETYINKTMEQAPLLSVEPKAYRKPERKSTETLKEFYSRYGHEMLAAYEAKTPIVISPDGKELKGGVNAIIAALICEIFGTRNPINFPRLGALLKKLRVERGMNDREIIEFICSKAGAEVRDCPVDYLAGCIKALAPQAPKVVKGSPAQAAKVKEEKAATPAPSPSPAPTPVITDRLEEARRRKAEQALAEQRRLNNGVAYNATNVARSRTLASIAL